MTTDSDILQPPQPHYTPIRLGATRSDRQRNSKLNISSRLTDPRLSNLAAFFNFDLVSQGYISGSATTFFKGDMAEIGISTKQQNDTAYNSSSQFVTGTTCARDEATKMAKKETLQWQTGYSPSPPTSSDRNQILFEV